MEGEANTCSRVGGSLCSGNYNGDGYHGEDPINASSAFRTPNPLTIIAGSTPLAAAILGNKVIDGSKYLDAAAEIASKLTKWAVAGKDAEARAGIFLREEGYTVLGTHVYIQTSAGLRITDYVVTGGPAGSSIVGYEVKANAATRSPSQVLKDNLIEKQGGTVVNRAQPAFNYGQPLQFKTYLLCVDLGCY